MAGFINGSDIFSMPVGIGHRQLLERIGLGDAQEGEELRHVERMGAVVVFWAPSEIAGAAIRRGRLGDTIRHDDEAIHAGHVTHDERFKSFFAGVRGHPSIPYQLPVNQNHAVPTILAHVTAL